MNLEKMMETIDDLDAGDRMYGFISDLLPICRSITGDGFRETLRRVRTLIPIDVREVPTGTQVFDWTVPKEWNIRDAWVKNEVGEKVLTSRSRASTSSTTASRFVA